VGGLGYQPALDGLRGVAIAAVVGFHAFAFPADGFLGVDLFFVLSGFLITTLLLDEQRAYGRVSLRGFYFRRGLRLLPALLALVAVFFAAQAVTGTLGMDTVAVVAVASTYTANMVLALGGPDALPALDHLWSLAAEEQFYLLWPPALILLARGRRAIAAALLAMALVASAAQQVTLAVSDAPGYRLDFGPDTRGSAIVIGCLFAIAFSTTSARSHRGLRLLAPVALTLVVAMLVADLGRDLYAGPLLVFGLCAGVVVTQATAGGTVTRALLSARPLVWLGRRSYSLYLWHVPVLVACGVIVSNQPAVGSPVRGALAVAASLAAASASYRFVEKPFLRFKDARALPHPPTPALPAAAQP